MNSHDGDAQAFGSVPVGDRIARALRAMRYQTPTPIQERTIPILRQGKDLLGQAPTGTGKTTAFGIPLIEAMVAGEPFVQAIILVPTRELCLQVTAELKQLGAHSNIRVAAVYGGVGLQPQIDAVRRGAQVVVGTPGRVEDLLQRRALTLGKVRFAVLDEADRMLDVGFLPAIERILKQTPSARQTALFSATMPQEVRDLAARHMRTPVTVEVDPERPTVEAIEQRFEHVADGDKLSALRAHLDDPACYLALVFRRTTFKADRLARDLSRKGYKVAPLHGRRSQSQRERVLADLKSGKLQALIATDIAARGLDINRLTHVFNYDLPDTPETYVHRIGRTGRAGETGVAITFVTPEDDKGIRELERYLALRRDRGPVKAKETPTAGKQPKGRGKSRQSAEKPHRRHEGSPASPPRRQEGAPSSPPRHRSRGRRRPLTNEQRERRAS